MLAMPHARPSCSGSLPTCDTAGVLGAAVMAVAGIQTLETIKVLIDSTQYTESRLFAFDLWDSTWKTIDLPVLSEAGCSSCHGDGTNGLTRLSTRQPFSGTRCRTASLH